MSSSAIEDQPNGSLIHLHVVPRASRTAIVGLHDGRVKIAVAAPPVDGEANDAIVRFLAKTLGVPRDAVRLASGATGKRKTVRVDGLGAHEIAAALGLPGHMEVGARRSEDETARERARRRGGGVP